MKRLTACVVLALLCAAAPWAQGDEPAKGVKLRVLVTVGGHAYEEAPFWAMWDAMPGVQWTKAEMPKQAGLLKPGLEKQYDVIAMYDLCPGITAEQQAAFVELLRKGIGVVAMHHNLGGHQQWDEFRTIVGGKYCMTDCTIDGQPHKQSTWDHDQQIKVTVVDKDHAITKGIEPFVIHDETYGGCWISPKSHVLLSTDHSKNAPGPICWTTKYGASPVAYLMLGHDSQAWKNPNYPKLLSQAIHWAAAR